MGKIEISDEQKDFFISYNSTDRNWAEWIAWQVEEVGHTVTIQHWDFQPGSNLILSMQKASQTSKRIILVLSQNFLDADHTASEWAAFYRHDPSGKQKTVLPVRVRECKPDGILGSLIYIDLVGLDESEARERLLVGIKEGRNKPLDPPKFPIRHTITQERPDFPASSSKQQPHLLAPSLSKEGGSLSSKSRRQIRFDQSSPPSHKKHNHRPVRKPIHWFIPLGLGMLTMLTLWALGSWILLWGADRYNDIRYGIPRTYQTDAIVGHNGDSPQHPSHFIALNYKRQAVVHEYMAGNPDKSVEYIAPMYIAGDGGDLAPVTLEFRDVNSDKKPDMIIHIYQPHQGEDELSVFLNTSAAFRPANTNDHIHL